MTSRQKIIRILFFIAAASVVVISLQKVFRRMDDDRAFHSVAQFYSLPKNSMDGVYIGSSSTYQFWQPPLAWKNHGITIYSFSAPSLPAAAVRFWLIEAHKYQPDALFLINLNCFCLNNGLTILGGHNASDFLRFSLNKVRMVYALASKMDLGTLPTAMELLFPMIRFHSTWNEIDSNDLYKEPIGVMGASQIPLFLSSKSKFEQIKSGDGSTEPLAARQKRELDALLETIEDLGVKVLFVNTPQIVEGERVQRGLYAEQYLTERGYDVLNLQQKASEMGLDPQMDFYNATHTNVHGSIKVTETISRYLIDHYGFSDRSGDPVLADWDAAAEKYDAILAPYIFDFEQECAPHLNDLPAPKKLECRAVSENGSGIGLSWSHAGSADGFALFRKADNNGWERIAEIDGGERTFVDEGLPPAASYSYTVVPFRETGGTRAYGRWSISGISTGFFYPAPEMTEIWEDENGITVRWDPAADEKDYKVYRRQDNGEWKVIAETKEPWYTDGNIQPGTAYDYSAAAVTQNGEGLHSETGIHWETAEAIGEVSR